MVSHPLPAGLPTAGTEKGYQQTLYGPPGPVAVLDGLLLGVRRWEGEPLLFGRFSQEDLAGWWDDAFGRHFYDMAFTFNASRAFQDAGLVRPATRWWPTSRMRAAARPIEPGWKPRGCS